MTAYLFLSWGCLFNCLWILITAICLLICFSIFKICCILDKLSKIICEVQTKLLRYFSDIVSHSNEELKTCIDQTVLALSMFFPLLLLSLFPNFSAKIYLDIDPIKNFALSKGLMVYINKKYSLLMRKNLQHINLYNIKRFPIFSFVNLLLSALVTIISAFFYLLVIVDFLAWLLHANRRNILFSSRHLALYTQHNPLSALSLFLLFFGYVILLLIPHFSEPLLSAECEN